LLPREWLHLLCLRSKRSEVRLFLFFLFFDSSPVPLPSVANYEDAVRNSAARGIEFEKLESPEAFRAKAPFLDGEMKCVLSSSSLSVFSGADFPRHTEVGAASTTLEADGPTLATRFKLLPTTARDEEFASLTVLPERSSLSSMGRTASALSSSRKTELGTSRTTSSLQPVLGWIPCSIRKNNYWRSGASLSPYVPGAHLPSLQHLACSWCYVHIKLTPEEAVRLKCVFCFLRFLLLSLVPTDQAR
jgi:hypothetical protein